MNAATAPSEAAGRSQISRYSIADPEHPAGVDLLRSLPFIFMHAGALLVFAVGVSGFAVLVALVALWARTFALTAGYHRLFAHRAFKARRGFAFALAWTGACAVQRGPLWWAAHHRHHHRYADTELDIHSPVKRGFFWSHMGWVMSPSYYKDVNYGLIPDFYRFPELRWVERNCLIPVAAYVLLLLGLGWWAETRLPQLNTSTAQVVVWGFFVSTVLLYHITFSVNSFAHLFGSRRFTTKDASRNNPWVAFLTFGEGWHNNHHRYPSSARQGFYWWEIDLTYYLLLFFQRLGWVSGVHKPPKYLYAEAKRGS